eukprot:1590832-Pyramimonas_sp.AAC.1
MYKQAAEKDSLGMRNSPVKLGSRGMEVRLRGLRRLKMKGGIEQPTRGRSQVPEEENNQRWHFT